MSAVPATNVRSVQLNPFVGIWNNLRRSPTGTIGSVIVAAHLILAVISPFVVPYDPAAFDSTAILQPPSAAHLFGTDNLGRDVFTRTLMGGRVALAVTIVGILLAVTWGSVLGILLGFLGGWVDELSMRLVDALRAIPEMLFLLLIAGIIGTANWILVLALGFLYGIEVVRIARAATLSVVAQDFVLAARARGEHRRTIVLRELLPNVFDILLVEGALRWSWMLLSFSALSFLGFGVVPPTPDWGLMIAQNNTTFGIAPWATFFPIAALSSLIVSVNLFMEAVARATGIDRVDGVAL